MRRVLAIVAMGGALLAAAACGPTTSDSAAAPTATSASPSPTGKTTKDVCATLEPAFVTWATEIGALPELSAKSTKADITAYFKSFHEATDKVVTALNSAGTDAGDPAFKQTLATLEKMIDDGNKAFTVESAAKGAKNPFEGDAFSNAADAVDKACSA
jgi:hypothetical protein